MPVIQLPIANGFYMSDSLPISAQECTNFYPNIPQAPALSQETLLGTPGTVEIGNTGVVADRKQANRGAHVMGAIPYFVNGGVLYRVNRSVNDKEVESFDIEPLGDIAGEGRVSLADNGQQLCILSPGGAGYIYDGSTLQEITDSDFRASGDPQHVVFIDGYFVFTTDSKKFIVSALNDGLSYNALDFGTAEADPDDIVAPIVFRNQLFIGGSETLEAFQNIGGADFPFRRTGLFIQKGVDSPFSVVEANDSFMFIGGGKNESPAIWALSGNTASKVSTTAIDSILQRFTEAEIKESFAWSYAQKGAYFVAFSLPTTTLVIDTITGRWHERKSRFIPPSGIPVAVRSRVNSLVSAYGRVLVGDGLDGRIGSLEPDVYTEYGNDIVRVIATQPFQNNMEALLVPSLELTMEAGVGNADAKNPIVRMDRSTDGGKTFSDDRSRPIGKVGDYGRRTIWRRNGRAARFEIFRFKLSDPVKPVIIQLTADIMGG